MSVAPVASSLFPELFTPTFSGHETFVLRSTWLTKAYDLLQENPNLFSMDDAFVKLGVGKNMAQSARFWGQACDVFGPAIDKREFAVTELGDQLLRDPDGWDRFLVTPASWWLLHWQIAARHDSPFTWFYTFNLLRGGEFTIPQLADQLQSYARERGWRVPSVSTITRDIDCMVRCYVRPSTKQLASASEDLVLCPITELGLIQRMPGLQSYRLVSGMHAELPDALVAYAIHELLDRSVNPRQTISFNELAYAPRSPGRVFRLDEDALLDRLQHIEESSQGLATYTDQAGIRQVLWHGPLGADIRMNLLARAFERELHHD